MRENMPYTINMLSVAMAPFCFCFAANVDPTESELTVLTINKDDMVSLREKHLS